MFGTANVKREKSVKWQSKEARLNKRNKNLTDSTRSHTHRDEISI